MEKEANPKTASSKTYKDPHINSEFLDTEGIGMNQNPEILMRTLKITPDPATILSHHLARTPCPNCTKKVKFYCTKCSLPTLSPLPTPSIPIKIQIIKHTKEKREKSSAYPLIFLSKNFSLLETDGSNWGQLPDLNFAENNNYVLYPHKDARLISQLSPKEFSEMQSIKIIDCTWAQSNAMLRGMPQGVKFLKLEDYETTFWRYQLHNNKCLATVEAVYYVLREWDDRRVEGGGGERN
jgi:DTW domain-containing protein YfiP